MRSSSSSSSGSYDLKDAMTDPNHKVEQAAPSRSGHASDPELDRDVSSQHDIQTSKNIFTYSLNSLEWKSSQMAGFSLF